MINIQPAQAKDIDRLAAIGIAAWKKGLKPLVPDSVASRIEQENPFLPFLQESTDHILVAWCDGVPAGFGACGSGENTISDLWVAPSFEGRGLGRALLKALEDVIRDKGYPEAKIEVAAANLRALSLYRYLNYRETWRGLRYDGVLEMDLEKIGLTKVLLR